MIYRSIDPTLCQETTTNKQVFSQILYLISGHENPSVSGSDDDGREDSASKEKPKEAPCNVHTLIRRERRAKARIKTLQKSLRLSKRKNKIQEEKIEHLSTALKETRTLLYERNTHITHLQKTIQQLEQTIEVLNIELTDVSKQIEQDLEKHEEEITELEAQICHLQEKCQTEVISSMTASSQKHEFTTNVRALYYSLLSMRVPPRQMKSVVKNVISNLVPSVNVDELRLPGRGNLVLLICVVMKCLQLVMFIKLLC